MAGRASTEGTVTRATAPRRQQRAEDTRERIMRACLDVVSQSGFQGMRVAEIAKLVGITEAGVLHHYPSKQALLAALLQYRDRAVSELAKEIHRQRGFAALLELQRVAVLITRDPVRAQLYLVLEAENLGPDRVSGDYFRRRNAATRRSIVRHIREAQEDGEAREGIDADAFAREAVAFMDGIGLQWLTARQRFDLVDAWRLYLEGLVERLRVPRPGPRTRR